MEHAIESPETLATSAYLNLRRLSTSFSIGWSIESPAHYPDKFRFLQELSRVIKPGGVIAVADLLAPHRTTLTSVESRQTYEQFLQMWDVPYLETFEGYKQILDESGFELYESEIITQNNLGIFKKYGELFLRLSRIRLLYLIYKHYLKWRTNGNIDNVYQHIFASCEALNKNMIGYGLFWAIRR